MRNSAAIQRDREILASGAHLASPAALAAHLSAGSYRRAKHIDYLSDALVDVAMGDCSRLMVLMPPRHSKSETCSHWFPVWHTALWPERRKILAGYGEEFARDWGGKVKNTVEQHWPELGVKLLEDTKAKHHWKTAEGGGMLTVGIGTGVTGKGGEVLILDDPTKDVEEAQSEVIQRRNWEWWKATFRTRLQPGGCIVVIGTRWDENDLLGKLLQAYRKGPGTEGYEPWRIVMFPAVATAPDVLGRTLGDPLWPEQYDLEALRALEVSSGPYWWAALFQQSPTPLGGNVIKESWWNYWVPQGTLGEWEPVVVGGRECRIVELPDGLREFQSWDMNFKDDIRAVSKGRQPDPVSGQCWGRDDADMYALDRVWGRYDLDETIAQVRLVSSRNPGATTKLVEYTANGPAVIRALRRQLGGFIPVTPRGSKLARVLGGPMTAGSTDSDKGARAVGMQAYVKGGNMYLPHPDLKPWVTEFRRNLGLFPRGGKDDTDAASQAWAYAQDPMWSEQDQQQREALKHGEPPKTTADILRKRLREGLEEEYKRAEAPHGPRRKRAFYLRRRR